MPKTLWPPSMPATPRLCPTSAPRAPRARSAATVAPGPKAKPAHRVNPAPRVPMAKPTHPASLVPKAKPNRPGPKASAAATGAAATAAAGVPGQKARRPLLLAKRQPRQRLLSSFAEVKKRPFRRAAFFILVITEAV